MGKARRHAGMATRDRRLLSTASLRHRLDALRDGEPAVEASASPPTPEAHALCVLLTVLACLLGAGLVVWFALYEDGGGGGALA